MKKCLIIINKMSGRANSINVDSIKSYIGSDYLFECACLDDSIQFDGYDTLAVCGGDGTLSSVMNMIKDIQINVIYFPFGTVNDRARTAGKQPATHCVIGNINGKTFTYVAACGTFTAIGYITSLKAKRRYKSLAYLFKAFAEYRVHRIRAKLQTDNETFDGEYTLIMIIKSKHCFYFPFNRLYNSKALDAHLLLIKSPKYGGIIGKVQLFFRFFGVFFMGIRKQIRKKNITFVSFKNLFINLSESADFCVDGEKVTLKEDINVNLRYACPSFVLIPRKNITSKSKNIAKVIN